VTERGMAHQVVESQVHHQVVESARGVHHQVIESRVHHQEVADQREVAESPTQGKESLTHQGEEVAERLAQGREVAQRTIHRPGGQVLD